jgi:hypothetical protein
MLQNGLRNRTSIVFFGMHTHGVSYEEEEGRRS